MSRAAVAPLIFGAAVVVGAEFVVIGLIPAMRTELDLAPARAGWLITVFALASALLGPILAAATVRFPAAPVLAAALLPFGANLLLLAFPSFALAITLRVLQGAALPLFMSLAGALLGAARGTGQGIALLYVGVTIGGTLAPPAGSLIAGRFGWQAPMALIGALALAAAALCLMRRQRVSTGAARAPWHLLTHAGLRGELLLSTLAFAAMFTGFSYIAVLLGRAAFDHNAIALALLGFGAAGLGGNWLAGRFAHRARAGTAATALLAAAMAGSIAADIGAFAAGLAMLVWGAAHAAGFVFCQIRVMDAAPAAPAFAGSLNISAANVGIAIGSVAGGQAVQLGGGTGLAAAATAFALATAAVATCRSRNVTQSSSFRNRTDTGIAPE